MGSGTNREVTLLLVAGLLALGVVAGVNRGTGPQHSFAQGIEPASASVQVARRVQAQQAEPLVPVSAAPAPGLVPAREDAAPEASIAAPRTLRLRKLSVRGRVVDLEGHGVSGIEVQSSGARADQRQPSTDAGGRFAVEVERGGGLLELGPSSGYLALASTRAGGSQEGLIVAAPTMGPLQVEVVDSVTGLPLPGARVELSLDGESALGVLLQEQLTREPRLHVLPLFSPSNVTGLALFHAPPGASQLVCAVSRPGYESVRVALSPSAAQRIALEPISIAAAMTGRVTDAAGKPVAGAEVASGARVARTRGDGTFTLNGGLDGTSSTVLVYHPQHGTARQVASGADLGDIALAPMPPAEPMPLLSGQGEVLASVRVVPVTEDGEPNPFAPHWHCAQADAMGRVALRPQLGDQDDSQRVAVTKDGTVLGRVALSPAGDSWLVD